MVHFMRAYRAIIEMLSRIEPYKLTVFMIAVTLISVLWILQ